MITETPPTPRTFIVIQNDPIVSMDLLGLLETSFPESAIHLFDQLEAASVMIEASMASACVLIGSNLVTKTSLASVEDFIARGARMVIVGGGDGVSFAAAVVNTPFTTEMILDVLA